MGNRVGSSVVSGWYSDTSEYLALGPVGGGSVLRLDSCVKLKDAGTACRAIMLSRRYYLQIRWFRSHHSPEFTSRSESGIGIRQALVMSSRNQRD